MSIVLRKKDKMFLNIADTVSECSTCQYFKVGAVIVKDDRIISIGYNGTPRGYEHCADRSFETREAHHKWSEKFEIHAEVNAILFAAKNGISIDGTTIFSTLQPCNNCLKMICNSGINRIIFKEKYDKFEVSPEILNLLNDLKIEYFQGK
jgi:dCMP deaminase